MCDGPCACFQLASRKLDPKDTDVCEVCGHSRGYHGDFRMRHRPVWGRDYLCLFCMRDIKAHRFYKPCDTFVASNVGDLCLDCSHVRKDHKGESFYSLSVEDGCVSSQIPKFEESISIEDSGVEDWSKVTDLSSWDVFVGYLPKLSLGKWIGSSESSDTFKGYEALRAQAAAYLRDMGEVARDVFLVEVVGVPEKVLDGWRSWAPILVPVGKGVVVGAGAFVGLMALNSAYWYSNSKKKFEGVADVLEDFKVFGTASVVGVGAILMGLGYTGPFKEVMFAGKNFDFISRLLISVWSRIKGSVMERVTELGREIAVCNITVQTSEVQATRDESLSKKWFAELEIMFLTLDFASYQHIISDLGTMGLNVVSPVVCFVATFTISYFVVGYFTNPYFKAAIGAAQYPSDIASACSSMFANMTGNLSLMGKSLKEEVVCASVLVAEKWATFWRGPCDIEYDTSEGKMRFTREGIEYVLKVESALRVYPLKQEYMQELLNGRIVAFYRKYYALLMNQGESVFARDRAAAVLKYEGPNDDEPDYGFWDHRNGIRFWNGNDHLLAQRRMDDLAQRGFKAGKAEALVGLEMKIRDLRRKINDPAFADYEADARGKLWEAEAEVERDFEQIYDGSWEANNGFLSGAQHKVWAQARADKQMASNLNKKLKDKDSATKDVNSKVNRDKADKGKSGLGYKVALKELGVEKIAKRAAGVNGAVFGENSNEANSMRREIVVIDGQVDQSAKSPFQGEFAIRFQKELKSLLAEAPPLDDSGKRFEWIEKRMGVRLLARDPDARAVEPGLVWYLGNLNLEKRWEYDDILNSRLFLDSGTTALLVKKKQAWGDLKINVRKGGVYLEPKVTASQHAADTEDAWAEILVENQERKEKEEKEKHHKKDKEEPKGKSVKFVGVKKEEFVKPDVKVPEGRSCGFCKWRSKFEGDIYCFGCGKSSDGVVVKIKWVCPCGKLNPAGAPRCFEKNCGKPRVAKAPQPILVAPKQEGHWTDDLEKPKEVKKVRSEGVDEKKSEEKSFESVTDNRGFIIEDFQKCVFPLKQGTVTVGSVFYVNLVGLGPRFLVNEHNVKRRRHIVIGDERFFFEDEKKFNVNNICKDFRAYELKVQLQGVKPLVMGQVKSGDKSFAGTLVGFCQARSFKFVVKPCNYLVREDDIIWHDGSTDFGDCGGVLVAGDGKVLGVHSTGSSGSTLFPNEAWALSTTKNC